MKQILKTSKQWYDELPEDKKIIILDPDGWDRSNYEYSFNEELITYDEFQKRVLFSTCMFNESVCEIQDNNIQDCEPIEIEDTVVSFNQPNSHGVVYRDNPFNMNETPEDNSHGDLVSLIHLIEKLRRREGGCIMNELIAEAKKHFSGLQYIKKDNYMNDKIIPLTYNGKVIGEVNIFNNVDSNVISEIFGDIIITTEEGREIINKLSQNTIGISARKFNPNSDVPINPNNFMEFSIITS